MRYLAILLALVGVAHADDKAKAISGALTDALAVSPKDDQLPSIVLLDQETKFKQPFIYGDGSPDSGLLHVVVGLAADGHAGWVAADSGVIIACGMGDCRKVLRDAAREANVKPPYHQTALVDDGKLLLVHIGSTGKGVGYDGAMEAQIADDAKPAVEQFQKSIADPKAFAAPATRERVTAPASFRHGWPRNPAEGRSDVRRRAAGPSSAA